MSNRRRKILLTEMKKLIMSNLPMTAQERGTIKQDLYEFCRQDAVSLGLQTDEIIFNLALSALVDNQFVVYFSDLDVRPTRCGLNAYN